MLTEHGEVNEFRNLLIRRWGMSVEIQLTEKYWLTSDRYSWALAKKRYRMDKETGERKRELVMEAWYGTLSDALQGCYERDLRMADAKSFEALAKHAAETVVRLGEATQGLDDVSLPGYNEESMT